MTSTISQPPSSNWYEIVSAKELARRLDVPVSWVYEQVRSRAKDPMPHLMFGRYRRFQPDHPDFRAWLERHRAGSRARIGRQSA